MGVSRETGGLRREGGGDHDGLWPPSWSQTEGLWKFCLHLAGPPVPRETVHYWAYQQ